MGWLWGWELVGGLEGHYIVPFVGACFSLLLEGLCLATIRPFWPLGRHSLTPFVPDAKKKRRKPKAKKPEPIILRDQSTSPCLPPTLLPPPPLPPPATTVTSMVAPSPPVYTMPRVFGPFPPLPSTSVSDSGRGSLACLLGITPAIPRPAAVGLKTFFLICREGSAGSSR